jgi:hypothetical protein
MESFETSKERDPTRVVFPSKLRENCMERPSSWPYKLEKNAPQLAHKNTSLHCANSGIGKRSA